MFWSQEHGADFSAFHKWRVVSLAFCICLHDEFLIASSTAVEHVANIRETPQRLKCTSVAFNPSEWMVGVLELIFLGLLVKQHGYRPLLERVSDIHKWQLSSTEKGLQWLLGSVNFYHQFIPYASQLQTLFYLIPVKVRKKEGPLIWSQDTCKAFERCK